MKMKMRFNATTAFLLPPGATTTALWSSVSMPPRRSCFRQVITAPHSTSSFNATTAFLLPLWVRWLDELEASFNATTAFLLRGMAPALGAAGAGFNATTAFLLQADALWNYQSVIRVSMPPRRSCFRRRGGGDRPGAGVSMPPRRSCFPQVLRPQDLPRREFQCHHGVPASGRRRLPPPGQGGVSMPPRRSCFPSWEEILGAAEKSFNATTAFLLPGGPVGPGPVGGVSMPPRRSCFRPCSGGPRPPMGGFNATTAFLLPPMGAGRTSTAP